MTTNIQPLHDRVIVKRIDEGEQVIAAGLGKYREDGSRQPLDVNAGDRVLFGKYGGSEIKVNGEELLIMREDEILGIITRAGAAAAAKKGK
jgi:chaperonin GroES